MEAWLTAAEIAALALPGLPTTKRRVNALASACGWDADARRARARQGHGGGLEYHIELLPPAARMAYAARIAATGNVMAALGAAPDIDGPMTAEAQGERDARLVILETYRAFVATSGLPATAAAEHFAASWAEGSVEAPAWVRQRITRFSGRTLRRWIADAATEGANVLAVDRGAARRGRGVLDLAEDGRVKTFILAHLVRNEQAPLVAIRKATVMRFGETVSVEGRQQPLPDVAQFQRVLKRWRTEHANELLLLTNPDAFKSRSRVSGSYLSQTTALNQLWQIDASPADVMCTDGRQTLYVCVDVWSRRMIVLVSATPRAEAVGLLLKTAILEWGVPERIKTDNGTDFAARSRAASLLISASFTIHLIRIHRSKKGSSSAPSAHCNGVLLRPCPASSAQCR